MILSVKTSVVLINNYNETNYTHFFNLLQIRAMGS